MSSGAPRVAAPSEGDWVETSALAQAALERWLDVRKNLVQRTAGTSLLWVSLWMNHDGVFDDQGNAVIPPGMPLEENGLIISYRVGRLRYDGLRQLLPLKLEPCGARWRLDANAPPPQSPSP